MDAVDVHQAQPGFVDERGGLKEVIGALAPHVAVGDAAEFRADEGHQPVERRLVAVAPGNQEARDIPRRRGSQGASFGKTERRPRFYHRPPTAAPVPDGEPGLPQ